MGGRTPLLTDSELLVKRINCDNNDIISNFCIGNFVINQPGMAEYFLSKQGRDLVKMILQRNQCTEVIDPMDELKKSASFVNISGNIRTKESVMKVNVVGGDITTVKADVIITSTSPGNFASCEGSTVSKALLHQAGNGLQAACHAASRPKPQLGDVIETPGFNLPCRKVYHVLLDDYTLITGLTILKKAVLKCLDMAEQAGHASIAFPALGTGGFGYPFNEVVALFGDVVRGHDGTKLQNVCFVFFKCDNITLKEIETKIFHQRPQTATKPYCARKTVQVVVKKGDITATSCKAIVNSTNRFDLSGAEKIAKAISQTSNIRVTSGGNLCKYIIHLNTRKRTSQLENMLIECFREADRLGVKDLAVPVVGTGECLSWAVNHFDKTIPKNLRKIEVYVSNGNMLPEFHEDASNPPTQSPGMFGIFKIAAKAALGSLVAPVGPMLVTSMKTLPTSVMSTKESSATKDPVCIVFYSKNANDIMKAFYEMQETVGELSIVKHIKNETIEKLTIEKEQELLSVAMKQNVFVEKKFSDELIFLGQNTKVLEVYSQANDIIHQFEKALQTSTCVTWKYVDHQDSKTKDFPLEVNHYLEKAYEKKEQKTEITSSFGGNQVQLQIDFVKMKADITAENQQMKLIRSVMENYPTTWDDMEELQWKRVEVLATSLEYETVLPKFKSSLSINTVVRLDRIQNPTLWKQFQAQKGKIEKKMQTTNVTKQLFHGTDGTSCDKIAQHGFDRSYVGKNGTVYGKGVYFATTAKYSETFAKPNAQGQRSMFLVEVVTGEYCRGKSDTNVIPTQSDGSLYDSVVDDVSNPTIFVIFRDASVYPTYILTYK